MTEKRASSAQPDYTKLPEPIDLSATVETQALDATVHEPESPFATPEIADMSRTGAIGAAF